MIRLKVLFALVWDIKAICSYFYFKRYLLSCKVCLRRCVVSSWRQTRTTHCAWKVVVVKQNLFVFHGNCFRLCSAFSMRFSLIPSPLVSAPVCTDFHFVFGCFFTNDFPLPPPLQSLIPSLVPLIATFFYWLSLVPRDLFLCVQFLSAPNLLF